jgi:hypothetical protein
MNQENNRYNDMEKELMKLISDQKFIDFLNTIEYKGYEIKYRNFKFIVILN